MTRFEILSLALQFLQLLADVIFSLIDKVKKKNNRPRKSRKRSSKRAR